jgi:hypothetical protein
VAPDSITLIFYENIVTYMTPTRQRLSKYVPEPYAVNNRGASVPEKQVARHVPATKNKHKSSLVVEQIFS